MHAILFKRIRELVLLILMPVTGVCQLPDMYNINWRCVGPAHFGGRVTCVTGAPGNYKTYFIGTAAGGLFRTSNGGTTFSLVFDDTNSPSIGAIAIAPSDNNIIYVGTGEGDPRNDISYGDGIYRSDDGGEAWLHIGLENTERFSSIVIHPDDPDIVYAAAMGKAWSESSDRGIYKSIDGGKSWARILYVNNTTGASALSIHPENTEIIYAGMYDYLRKPWHFRSGGSGSGLYRSEDAGKTWTLLTDPSLNNGLPGEKLLGRIDVDISSANPDVIYSMIESQEDGELWRSDNAGKTWAMVNDDHRINNRPFYYTTLFISPEDPYKVWALAGSLYYSEDGGENFSRNRGTTFGDHHAFWIDPEDPDHVLNGCDGGASVSFDRGTSWTYLNNIPMAQAYHVGFDMQYPYNIYSGFQDHEIWKGPSQRWAQTGSTGKDWTRLRDMADGMNAFAHPSDNNIIIYNGHFGDITKTDLRTGEERFIQPYPIGPSGTSAADEKYRFNWDSPIALSPHNPEILYYGGNVLFRSDDRGETWKIISPDLTTNDPDKMKLSGGPISPDNTRAEYHCTIVSIAESPVKQGLIIVGTDDGNLQLTEDNGKTWKNLSDHLPGPVSGWISEVIASRISENRIYVSIDQHRLGDFGSYIFRSDNMGLSWEKITEGMKSYVHCVKEDPMYPDLLFAGTERGIFVSFNSGDIWHSLNMGIPELPVYDIQIHPRENDLIIATHGRGIYILDDISWMRKIADMENGRPYLLSTRDAFRYIPVSDRSRQGDDIYIAPNPQYGAFINYFIPDSNTVGNPDIFISGGDNNLIWQFSTDTLPGMHRLVWNLGEDLSLSNEDIITDRYAGRHKMPPGTYFVTLSVDSRELDRKTIEVFPDPRNDIPAGNTKECYLLVHELALRMNMLLNISPDDPVILSRMNWLYNQVRKNSDKPTPAQEYWIRMLIKQADDMLKNWGETHNGF
ncbi:MAG: hypothetical protein JW965_11185 [Bacteroidales bacterium]|nr:hypothetical protein [Bacteroidales bacterium]